MPEPSIRPLVAALAVSLVASFAGRAFALVPNGGACTAPAECASTWCVQGVCCDTACGPDACHACTQAAGAAADGTCTALTGPACDDGNHCTLTAACMAGTCTAVTSVSCASSDACHAAVCEPVTGGCVQTRTPDGTPCDDHDACTQNDICQMGTCVGGTAVVCVAQDACHAAGVCDPQTGCTNPLLPSCDAPPPSGTGAPADIAAGRDGCQHAPGPPALPAGSAAAAVLLALAFSRAVASRP